MTATLPARPRGTLPSAVRTMRVLRMVRLAGVLVLGLQLVGMIVFSTIEYQRYSVGYGFGIYAQAWTAIAHGHLDPWSSLIGRSFWRNDGELMLWGIAPLHVVYGHAVVLLWLQDLAIVLTELVAFDWVRAVLERSGPRLGDPSRIVLSVGVVVALVADPFVYETMGYDFHTEVFAALFVLLVARCLWSGARRLLWLWVGLALVTCGLAGLYLFGVGLGAAIASRSGRRAGLLVAGAGLVWFAVLGHLGADQYGGHGSLAGWYGYLTDSSHGHVGALDVVLGLVEHPLRAWQMAWPRAVPILDFLLAAGLVGVASPWVLPVALVVIAPSAINANSSFLNPHASFQTWPALPFVLVGTVMVLAHLVVRGGRGPLLARGVAAGWLCSLAVLGSVLMPDVGRFAIAVDSSSGGELALLDRSIPAGAEVVASWSIVGRFAESRDRVFAYGTLDHRIPVESPTVVFVLTPGLGRWRVPGSEGRAAVAYIESKLHGRVLHARGDVVGLLWHPPSGVSRVELP